MSTEAMLWQPSAERVARANITEFSRIAASSRAAASRLRRAVAVVDDEREAFWRAMWEFGGVIGDRGERTLRRPRPDARRPLVSRRAAQLRRELSSGGARPTTRPTPRVSRRGQARESRLARELVATVSRVAAALKALGIAPGTALPPTSQSSRGHRRGAGRDEPRRRVVVVLAGFRRAGRPRSLRPDRAARLFTVDGYWYNGKPLPVSTRSRQSPRDCRPSSVSSSSRISSERAGPQDFRRFAMP
jgi:hypothetical protein